MKKKILALVLAIAIMIPAACLAVSGASFSLVIPSTVSAHNLEAYGLHTMNVYATDTAPAVDGVISTGEYPGPDNGCVSSAVYGDGLWVVIHTKNADTSENGYNAGTDVTDYIDPVDMPEYINTYLTYDDDYFYFAVTTLMPAIRLTSSAQYSDFCDYDFVGSAGTARRRNNAWYMDTRLNFMQTDDLYLAYASQAYNRYNFAKEPALGVAVQPTGASIWCASESTKTGRQFLQAIDKSILTHYVDAYIDASGTVWKSDTYRRAENFSYLIDVQPDGRWAVTFEGRQPLGDVLRITDVEYDDGTPIDYVPEWGNFMVSIRGQASKTVQRTAPNGTEFTIRRDEVIWYQTGLPGYGVHHTGKNSIVNGITFTNTVYDATKSNFKGAAYFLPQPVHFLGTYEPTFDYNSQYAKPTEGISATATSRITRTRNMMLTSAVRGVNGRVIGIATQSAKGTGDNLMTYLVLGGMMLLCAAGTVTVFVVQRKRRAQQNKTL